MGGVFYLKFRDTLPVFEVALKNPDLTPYNLTGSTAWKLHIKLNTGTVLSRTMAIFGVATNGILRYSWVSTDWDTGNLILGPTPPLKPSQSEHRMEYEVLAAGGLRVTFPNDGYDTLRIISDIGQQ